MIDMTKLAQIAAEHAKPGEINILTVEHDDGCPAMLTWDSGDCTCAVVRVRVHQDVNRFERDLNAAREMNRKARRAAERAMRKAAGKTKAARATGAASKTTSVDGNCSTGAKKGGAV